MLTMIMKTIITLLCFLSAEGFTSRPSVRIDSCRISSSLSVFGGRAKKTTKSSSSPLVEEALSAYPYVLTDAAKKAGCIANFNEMASLYGDENALAMVKLEPKTLTFNKDNYAFQLANWEEQFGLEAAQAMVGRNPGLLAMRPAQTDNAESCMALSYVIAVTRSLPFKLAVAAGALYAFTPGVRPEFLDTYRELL